MSPPLPPQPTTLQQTATSSLHQSNKDVMSQSHQQCEYYPNVRWDSKKTSESLCRHMLLYGRVARNRITVYVYNWHPDKSQNLRESVKDMIKVLRQRGFVCFVSVFVFCKCILISTVCVFFCFFLFVFIFVLWVCCVNECDTQIHFFCYA